MITVTLAFPGVSRVTKSVKTFFLFFFIIVCIPGSCAVGTENAIRPYPVLWSIFSPTKRKALTSYKQRIIYTQNIDRLK